MSDIAEAIVVGAGLSGLVAAVELSDAGYRVLIVDQENSNNAGGQAFWSSGGIFLVDSPEQRRLGIKDSPELATQDWLGAADFDPGPTDHWPRQWARSYLDFAAGEQRRWLKDLGLGIFPLVGWAERGGYGARGPGNSVPRFHTIWGMGPALVAAFHRRALAAADRGAIRFAHRHRVDHIVADGHNCAVRGMVLESSTAGRGVASSRTRVRDFEFAARALIIASGGFGANLELIKQNWPARAGRVPDHMLIGVPAHVDGRMLAIAEAAGANLVHQDRMWHYPEGLVNHDAVWPGHGVRLNPGPSALWLDATGRRLPAPLFPGFDTLGALEHIVATGHDYSWLILNRRILGKEFGLSGQEQNPDITGRNIGLLLARLRKTGMGPMRRFEESGFDFVIRDRLPDLVAGMNELAGTALLDPDDIDTEVTARDREMTNRYSKDPQLAALHMARRYPADRLTRLAAPHRLLDPEAGPLIAIRMHLITRKSLGGLETDLTARVLRPDGTPFDALYAIGEAAGFGGGGIHGHRSLEGTFLGGCLFSARTAARHIASIL